MDVLITQDGDVIYKLRLRGTINTPVHLFFTYTEVGGAGAEMNQTTVASFNGTDFIVHLEFNSQIPFSKFRVGVALMSRFTLGPFTEAFGQYGNILVSPITQVQIS